MVACATPGGDRPGQDEDASAIGEIKGPDRNIGCAEAQKFEVIIPEVDRLVLEITKRESTYAFVVVRTPEQGAAC